MATWRKRDLERRRSERRVRVGRLVRPELAAAVVALAVAGVALWQALAAQSRADLLAHDLEAAQARLRAEAPGPVSAPAGASGLAPGLAAPAPVPGGGPGG